MFSRTLLTSIVVFGVSNAYAAEEVGFRQTALVDGSNRPLPVSVWYPTDATGPHIMIGDNPAFQGVELIQDAAPPSGEHPLVVLSHGYGGSWRNLSWLAYTLAQDGYVVAAADHPGTTTFNRDAEQAAASWERPHDVSRVIDRMLEDSSIAGKIDETRIAAVGHSLGGWTVAAASGARVSTALNKAVCEKGESPAVCRLIDQLGFTNPEVERDMTDNRIGVFVSLDLGGALGFTPESLAAIDKPFLVIAAGVNTAHLPSQIESGYLAHHLPEATSTFVTIVDATHFSFMQDCKPGAVELIEQEDPGDGIVCQDGGERSRVAIHSEISKRIKDFLAAAFSTQ